MIKEYFQLRKKREKFQNLMVSIGLDSNFYLIEDKPIKNGHILRVGIPTTSSYKKFEEKKQQLESHFKGIIEMEHIRFTSIIQMKIITKDLGKYPFEVVKTYANKLWIGKEFDGTDFFLDLDKEGHLLFGGQSGTGKSFGLAGIMANLIYNSSDHIEIYLNQTMKGDICAFSKCKCVKATAYTLEEVHCILKKVAAKVDERAKLFASLGIKNLTHYIQKTKKSMKRIFFIVEEASFLNNEECYNEFIKICRAGRSAGIHLIMLVQRSTLENLSGELKSQMCCCTTWQRSDIDSRNIIETSEAKNLEERELYIWGRKGLTLLKMPFIDEDFNDLKKFVPEIITYDDSKEVKEEVKSKSFKIESFDVYDDIKLEDYNKITAKKENIVANNEASQEITEEPPKKKRGRRKKGAVIEDVAITTER